MFKTGDIVKDERGYSGKVIGTATLHRDVYDNPTAPLALMMASMRTVTTPQVIVAFDDGEILSFTGNDIYKLS